MLEDLKRMLGLSGQKDEELDQKLNWILLGGIDPEDDLNYIITEVSIVRYNRIGSEGFQSHTVEGESVGFLNSDFDAYMDDIQAYKDAKNIDVSKGGIRWI